jgi:hypothetical protein
VRAAGLLAGHYHFNGYGDPTSDADFFCNNILYQPGDLLALDCESEGSMPYWGPAKAYAFHARVGQRMGHVSDTYMSSSVTKAQNWTQVVNQGSKLWVAQYGTNNGAPQGSPNIAYWPTWKLWQFTSMAVIPGYAGRLDANTTNSTTEWAGGGATPIQESDEMPIKYTLNQSADSQSFYFSGPCPTFPVPNMTWYTVLQSYAAQANAGGPITLTEGQWQIVRTATGAQSFTDAQIAELGKEIASNIVIPVAPDGTVDYDRIQTMVNGAVGQIHNFTYKAE